MKHRPLLHIALGLSWLTLASCANESTEPNAAPTAAGPELAVASNTWLTRAKMPGIERWDFATATLTNAAGQSIFYAIAGEIPNGATLGTVYAYNVATNSWTRKPDMPAALAGSRAAVIDGKIYVAGGTPTGWWGRTKGPSSSLFVYDPATNAWTRKRNMPEAGAGGVASVIGGKLYLLTTCFELDPNGYWNDCQTFSGGRPGVSNFFRYNPATDTWVRLPSPSHTYQIGAVFNKKLYVIDPELEVYDPATNQWTNKGETPGDIWGTGLALGGKLWVVGGTSETGAWISRLVIFDPVSNSWTYRSVPVSLNYVQAGRVFLNGQARIEVIGAYPYETNKNMQYVP